MSTSGSLNYNFETILNNTRKKFQMELKIKWESHIKESNEIINNIKEQNNYIGTFTDKVVEEVDKLNKDLEYYSELKINQTIDQSLETCKNTIESNYRTLSNYYSKYMFNRFETMSEKFNELENKQATISENIDKYENKQDEISKKMNNFEDKVEGLGAIFLNIVLTISIVSSMVAVLSKAKIEYAIPIALVCSWLLLSSIIFIGKYFKKTSEDKNSTFEKKIYIILSTITFASMITPLCYNTISKKICSNVIQEIYVIGNKSETRYNIISDNMIIDKFLDDLSPYWYDDINYIKNKDYLNSENINSIIFYKNYENNMYLYRYEIFLIDGRIININVDHKLLEEWIEDNNIIR